MIKPPITQHENGDVTSGPENLVIASWILDEANNVLVHENGDAMLCISREDFAQIVSLANRTAHLYHACEVALHCMENQGCEPSAINIVRAALEGGRP